MKAVLVGLVIGVLGFSGFGAHAPSAAGPKLEVIAVTVSKAQGFRQTGPEELVAEPEAPFALTCVAVVESAVLHEASVHPPGDSSALELRPLDALPGTVPAWAAGESFDTRGEMDAEYLDGVYSAVIRCSIATTAMEISVAASLPAGPDASVPRLLNYGAVRCVDPSQPFTLRLAPFEQGSVLDQATVEIRANGEGMGVAFSGVATPGLDGAWASTIPPGLLEAEREYTVRVSYVKVVGMGQTNLILNAGSALVSGVLLTSRSASNRFLLGTYRCPTVKILREGNEGGTLVRFDSTPGTAYQIEESVDLRDWRVLGSTNAVGNMVEVLAPFSSDPGARFLRVLRQ